MEIRSYQLPPTALIPNSPQPLLHYRRFFATTEEGSGQGAQAYDLFTSNGWNVCWIFRYGPTQKSHYHSRAHECMAVLSGTATIRFGVADTASDLAASTHGPGQEEGGIELQAEAGDVFILPAGTAHKTFDASPSSSLTLLTPGDAHHPLTKEEIASVPLSGFTMIGAYPVNSEWDFATGGEDAGNYERVWSVPVPDNDPALGKAEQGICGRWRA